MARNGKKPTTPQFNTTFVRCELTSEDKKAVGPWKTKNRENFDDLCTEVVQSGHKISMSFNDNTDSFICSITGKPEGCDNAGKCYTSHAKNYPDAIWVALYKFHVIFQRGVWEDVGEESDFG